MGKQINKQQQQQQPTTHFSCAVKISKVLLESIWLSMLRKGMETLVEDRVKVMSQGQLRLPCAHRGNVVPGDRGHFKVWSCVVVLTAPSETKT